MKKLLILALCTSILTSCNEQDVTAEDSNPDNNNIVLNFQAFYGEKVLNTDSIYTNPAGNEFFVDSVKVFVNNLMFADEILADTLGQNTTDYLYIGHEGQSQPFAKLPPAGYTGRFGMFIGCEIDSTGQHLNGVPQELRREGVQTLFGHDFIKIWGRALDPFSADTTGSLAFEYTIGTADLSTMVWSDRQAFSVNDRRNINLFLQMNMKPAMEIVNIDFVRNITSDPTNSADYTIAETMRDSLKFNLF